MSSSMLSTTMNSPVSGPVAVAASKTCYQNQTFNKTYNIYSLFMQTSMNFVTTSHVIELKHCCCHCVQHSSDSDLELFTPEQKLRLLRLLTQNSVTGDNWSWLWLMVASSGPVQWQSSGVDDNQPSQSNLAAGCGPGCGWSCWSVKAWSQSVRIRPTQLHYNIPGCSPVLYTSTLVISAKY